MVVGHRNRLGEVAVVAVVGVEEAEERMQGLVLDRFSYSGEGKLVVVVEQEGLVHLEDQVVPVVLELLVLLDRLGVLGVQLLLVLPVPLVVPVVLDLLVVLVVLEVELHKLGQVRNQLLVLVDLLLKVEFLDKYKVVQHIHMEIVCLLKIKLSIYA